MLNGDRSGFKLRCSPGYARVRSPTAAQIKYPSPAIAPLYNPYRMANCLVLTPWYSAHNVVSWQAAITLLYTEKAERVIDYDECVRSPSITMKLPSVIRLKKPLKGMKRGIKFSRMSVYLRDSFVCQYCGNQFHFKDLSYDHVTPRVLGGKTNFENIVTACKNCNIKKGSKTCKEAGMYPLKKPETPKFLPYNPPRIDRGQAPDEWLPFLRGGIP